MITSALPKARIKGIISFLFPVLGLSAVLSFTIQEVRQEETITLVHYTQSLLALCSCAVLSLLMFKHRSLRLHGLDLLMILWGLYMVVNYYFISTVASHTQAIKIVLMFCLYFLMRVLFSCSKRSQSILFVLVVLCGFYESTLGLFQLLGWSPSPHSLFKLSGSFFNPGPYAGFLVTILSITTAYALKYNHRFFESIGKGVKHFIQTPRLLLHLLVALFLFTAVLVLPATWSRAAFTAYGVVLALMFLRRKSLGFILFFVGAGLCLGMGMYFIKQGSADGRVLMWIVSGLVISSHSAGGVGLGGFPAAYAKAQMHYFKVHPESQFLEVASCPTYAFNEYIDLGVEQGLIGLTLFLLIVCYSFVLLFRQQSPFAYGLLALLVFAFFSYPFHLLPFQILLLLFLALSASEDRVVQNKSQRAKYPAISILLLLLGILYFEYPQIKQKIQALNEFEQLAYLYPFSYVEGSSKDYSTLYASLRDNPRYLFAYGKALQADGHYNESNYRLAEGASLSSDPMFYNIMGNNYRSLGAYTEAEHYYQRAFEQLPNRMYPLSLLLDLYVEQGELDKAKELAKRIIGMKPKIESHATEEMREKAKQILEKIENHSIRSAMN